VLPLYFKIKNNEMKKIFLALVVLCGMAVAFVGCEPELKNARGQVKSIEISNDTLKSMVLIIDGQDKVVNLTAAKFQNGIAIQGDSVILDYIDGRADSLRGLVVTVLPKPAHYFEPSDTLITRDSKSTADSIQ
jgi:hypothetical protein